MKILFLDIDGVLNSIDYYTELDKHVTDSVFDRLSDDLNPVAVDLLKEFVVEYDIDIVISSTWRKLFSIAELKDLFALVGWEGIPIIDVTPLSRNGFRGDEILEWIEPFKNEVEQYLILDDDSDFTPQQKKENFIHTNGLTGLLQKHIEQMKQKSGKT